MCCWVVAVVAALQSPHAESTVTLVEQGLGAVAQLACDSANCAKLVKCGACAGACAVAVRGWWMGEIHIALWPLNGIGLQMFT